MARYALWPFRPAPSAALAGAAASGVTAGGVTAGGVSTATSPSLAGKLDQTDRRLSALSTRLREVQAAGEHAQLFSLEHELRAALHEVRFTAPGYRPVSLSAALVRAADTLRAVGIELDIAAALETASAWVAGAPGWSPQACDALGWVLRECTANILRHSTAHRAWISLSPTADGLRLAIGNNGVPRRRGGPERSGFGEERSGSRHRPLGPGSGSGIPSMLAQVSVMGGTLRVDRSDSRFELVAVVPTTPRSGVRATAGSV
ncbi:Two component signal transduction histidine kinase [Kitasatospora sp. MMS16-BH015]|uniref:sensor histidine kinase n=1 Tax=Kitasatospora sp. MMS16-BH015 TaxID=2018025 RepID=UPI000CA0B484|nr:hypothetical protein [Kitasatospora sp. MMS16-BH015]AUG77379.1 Two component signal transduction histidine kinase [Kitasatospora sp. MMS16-BH015]